MATVKKAWVIKDPLRELFWFNLKSGDEHKFDSNFTAYPDRAARFKSREEAEAYLVLVEPDRIYSIGAIYKVIP